MTVAEAWAVWLAAAALVVTLVTWWQGHQLAKRTLALEEARAAQEARARGKAQLRAVATGDDRSGSLVIVNSGSAAARDVRVTFNGVPVTPEGWGREWDVPSTILPGGEVVFPVYGGAGTLSAVRIGLEWADDSGEPGRYVSEVIMR